MKTDTRVDNKKYGLAAESKVWCAAHPVLRHKLTKLRDERTDSRVFRQLLREVTFYLGYDATDDLDTTPKKIKTPKGDHEGAELSTSVAIVPILRAGLGMVEPMLDLLPNATVHHIGMYRNKQSLLPVQYYNKLPKECNVDIAIILEPVIATAGTILATLAVLKTWGVEKIKIVSTIASKQGLQEVCAKNPDVEIFLAAIDDGLTDVRSPRLVQLAKMWLQDVSTSHVFDRLLCRCLDRMATSCLVSAMPVIASSKRVYSWRRLNKPTRSRSCRHGRRRYSSNLKCVSSLIIFTFCGAQNTRISSQITVSN
ncbi:hypothetical protein DVH05_006147 [Phytophthora capsici]|nr:hypothetical protein DVH05_006147 [Phytophthora capsici]